MEPLIYVRLPPTMVLAHDRNILFRLRAVRRAMIASGNYLRGYFNREKTDMEDLKLAEIEELYEASEGCCSNCGARGQPAEPDAENYRCDECDALAVHGAIYWLMRAR